MPFKVTDLNEWHQILRKPFNSSIKCHCEYINVDTNILQHSDSCLWASERHRHGKIDNTSRYLGLQFHFSYMLSNAKKSKIFSTETQGHNKGAEENADGLVWSFFCWQEVTKWWIWYSVTQLCYLQAESHSPKRRKIEFAKTFLFHSSDKKKVPSHGNLPREQGYKRLPSRRLLYMTADSHLRGMQGTLTSAWK